MYIKRIRINSYDVDRDNNAKISSIMKHFQQIARENLDQFGMTYSFLRDHNIVFVLTKYKFKFNGNLNCDETYVFKTAPCQVQGVSFIRDFIVEDDHGNILCEASSSWVIIDFEKRSILRPNKLPLPVPAEDKLVDFSPERIGTNVREGNIKKYTTVVKYSELDANNHLNNCCYADILLDGLFSINGEVPFIKEMDMSFDHEAAVGSSLTVEYDFDTDSCFIKCNNDTSASLCFSANIKF